MLPTMLPTRGNADTAIGGVIAGFRSALPDAAVTRLRS